MLLSLLSITFNLRWGTRLNKRKGDTYDLIYLSDIESGYEWIAKKEFPCLLNEVSSMDIH